MLRRGASNDLFTAVLLEEGGGGGVGVGRGLPPKIWSINICSPKGYSPLF